MTASVPNGTSGAHEQCPECHGQLIDGKIAIPIVGSLRFVYRLGTNEVSTEVVARMCSNCGHVALRGRDPDLIRRAEAASGQIRPVRRAFRTPRTPTGNHTQDGQE